MTGLFSDCRHAARLYARTPAASAIAVFALAISMAIVSACLSLYVDVALRPHPGFAQGGRLVTLGQTNGNQLFSLPTGLIERMAEEMTSLEAVAGLWLTEQQRGGAEPVPIELVTKEFFGGLRPRLYTGRGFEPADHDPNAEPVAVISYRYWQDELGGEIEVLGTIIEVGLRSLVTSESEEAPAEYRIVGIMSPDMTGLWAERPGIWLPLERAVGLDRIASMMVFGRRSDGASLRAVRDELNARYRGDADGYRLQPGTRLDAAGGLVRNIIVQRSAKRQLQLFLAASLLLALVAAANVSLFLLARAPGRRRELGVRMAVGAPLRRLRRQLASEAALLVAVAIVPGLAMSIWLSEFLRGLAFLRQAQWHDVTLLDWRVLVLVAVFLLVLTLLVSLVPILGLNRVGIAASSRQVTARATVAQRIAGIAQIAVAGALGGAAIAFAWHQGALIFGDPGYDIRDRYRVVFSPDIETETFEDFQKYMAFMTAQVVALPGRRAAIEAIPGVSDVGFGTPVPGQRGSSWIPIPKPDNPAEQVQVTLGALDSRYVDVLGLRLLHGREAGDAEVGVALVNQAFARAFFGRDNVVGESVPLGAAAEAPRPQIIGVLEDLSFGHPTATAEPVLFRTEGFSLASTAIIESSLTAAALQQALQRVIDAAEPELNVTSVQPLGRLRSEQLAPDRARGLLTIACATLVVLLAVFGFYGTQRYLVVAGRREYAVRASLGAGPRALGRLVLSRGLMLSLPGLVLGALLAFIVVAWLRGDFVARDISPGIVTFAFVVLLTLLLLIASLGPAHQARRTQPAGLLRED